MRVGVIVPAYNEEASIRRVIDEIKKQSQVEDIVVVDDGSTDATPAIVRALSVHSIRLSPQSGVGEAVRQGLVYALNKRWDIAIQIDADGEHDPAFIPLLIRRVRRGADVAIGSRFIAHRPRQAFFRSLGRRGASWALRLLCGHTIHDPTSGYRAFGARAMVRCSQYYPRRFPEPESLVALFLAGCQIVEVPVVVRPRFGGISSITFWKSMALGVHIPMGMVFQYIKGRFFL
jgi:glycosyltransferase involved in cell wall biosynthesis